MKVMFRGGSHDGEVINVDSSLPDYWYLDERVKPLVAKYEDYDKAFPLVIKCNVETYTRKDFITNRGKYSEYHEVKL